MGLRGRIVVGVLLLPLLVFAVVSETFPAYPRDPIGFALTPIMGLALVLIYGSLAHLAGRFRRRYPEFLTKTTSAARIAGAVGGTLLLFALCGLVWYLQYRYLGDPLGSFSRWIRPHYH